jgi:DNA-nicking Smr family endonuclease
MAKDHDLFKAAMAGVAPLRGRRSTAKAAPSPAAPRDGAEAKKVEPVSASLPGAKERDHGLNFDRDVDRALARGRRAPEASLDLHGMTLAAAERAVSVFLASSAAQGRRVVLVVTGKGLRLDAGRVFGGRIRAEFPGWLDRADNRALVTGFRVAHARHGGGGAFYVLLRRRSLPA